MASGRQTAYLEMRSLAVSDKHRGIKSGGTTPIFVARIHSEISPILNCVYTTWYRLVK